MREGRRVMVDVERMVRAQIALSKNYGAAQAERPRPGRGEVRNVGYGPYVLISRETGAGGSEVGEFVGQQLGWQVFDRSLVDAIADRAHVRRELIASLDERDLTTIRSAVASILHHEAIEPAAYYRSLHEILLMLAHQGDVVIVGRGAEFLLPNKFGLRVRVIAPIDARIQRVASTRGLSADQARAEIERADRERVRAVRLQFGRDGRDPLAHDLTINTAEVALETAADLIMAGIKSKLGVEPKRSGERAIDLVNAA